MIAKYKNKIERNFKQQMFDLLTSNIVDKLLNSINIYILIAWVGLAGFGIWSVLMSFLLISDSIFSMGASTYSLEYLIQNNSKNKISNLINFIIIILIVKLSILFLFALVRDYKFLDPIGGNLVLISLGLFLSFQEISKVLQSICQVNNLTDKILYSRLLQSILRTLLLFLFFYFKFPIVLASIPYISSTLICCIFLILFWQRNYSILKLKKFFINFFNIFSNFKIFNYFIPFLKKSLPFALSAMTIFLYLKSDIICLQFFAIEKSLIGNYSFSSTIASSIYFIPFNAYRVLLSSFNGKNIKNILGRYKKKVFFVCFLILLIQQIVYFGIKIYLPEFYPSIIFRTVNFLIILSFGILGICLSEYSALSFALINKNWLVNLRSIITFSLNICFNLFLIPIYGANGAAIGTTLALVLSGLFMLFLKIYYFNKLKIIN